MDLVLVDGANVYNSVASHLAENAGSAKTEIREYFLHWFDLDRFAKETLHTSSDPALGIVAIHSNKPLGAGDYRIKDQDLTAFWGRQAGAPNTSCMLVDVPGEQRETYRFECKKCNHPNEALSTGEKGVDNAMTVHLFESAGSWDSACIFSRDADFVPTIWALRRRGKKVFVAAKERDRQGALARASQSFFALALDFALHDFLAFLFLRNDGVLDRMVASFASGREGSVRCFLNPDNIMVATTSPHGPRLNQAIVNTVGVKSRDLATTLHVPYFVFEFQSDMAYPMLTVGYGQHLRRPLLHLAEQPRWVSLIREDLIPASFAD